MMKTISVLTLILFVLSSFNLFAQTNSSAGASKSVKNRVIIKTDAKEPFTVFLNGQKRTERPGTKHVFENLERQSFNLKIDFVKSNLNAINKKLLVKDGKEATYDLKKLGNGQFAFQLAGEKNLPNFKDKAKETGSLTSGNSSGAIKNDNSSSAGASAVIKNRVIIYNTTNQPFYVFLNGKKTSVKAESRYELENLDKQSFNLKIDFNRTTIQPITKKLLVKDGKEATYKLTKLNNGQYSFQLEKERTLAGNGSGPHNLSGGNSAGATKKDDNSSAAATKTNNNRVIIYTNDKEPFTIFLNGKKETERPGTTHTLENLDRQSYNLKIDFFKNNLNSINKKLLVKDGMETTYKLRKGSNGQYIFQMEKERALNGKTKEKNDLMGPQGSKKKVTPHMQDQSVMAM